MVMAGNTIKPSCEHLVGLRNPRSVNDEVHGKA